MPSGGRGSALAPPPSTPRTSPRWSSRSVMIRRKLLDSKGSDALPLAIVRRFGLAGIAVAIVLLAGCARPRVVIAPSPPAARIGYEEPGLASRDGNPYPGRPAARRGGDDQMEIAPAQPTPPLHHWLR